MKILCLDTSSRYLCLGLVNEGRTFEYSLDTGMALSRVLVSTIERALKAADMEPADIGHYAMGLGPGSFTALRIGIAAVKAMAWANRVRIAGIPTLEIIAAHPGIPEGIIAPVIDAKRSMLYCGWYSKASGRLSRIGAESLLSYDDFILRLKKIKSAHSKKSIIIGGDGLNVCLHRVKASFPGAILLEKGLWYPQPQPLISLALRSIDARRQIHPFKLEPIYLYPQECQIRTSQAR
jgi:tRNA threonylcarbamoyladenosine biosynthesis protein TsaB